MADKPRAETRETAKPRNPVIVQDIVMYIYIYIYIYQKNKILLKGLFVYLDVSPCISNEFLLV